MSALARSLGLFCLLGLTQCHQPPEPERISERAQPGAASAEQTKATGPSPGSVADVAPAAGGEPEANAAPSAGLGQWQEASLYKFKAIAIHRCAGQGAGQGRGQGAGAGAANAPTRVGITVQISAKVDSLLASPRDVTIEHAGVILEAELSPSPACGTPLPTKQLRNGEAALGSVVFTLPDADFSRALSLHFKPTRWGGAPGVTLALPECLADCGVGNPKPTQISVR